MKKYFMRGKSFFRILQMSVLKKLIVFDFNSRSSIIDSILRPEYNTLGFGALSIFASVSLHSKITKGKKRVS